VGETLERENLLQNVQEQGEQLRSGLRVIAAKYPNTIARSARLGFDQRYGVECKHPDYSVMSSKLP